VLEESPVWDLARGFVRSLEQMTVRVALALCLCAFAFALGGWTAASRSASVAPPAPTFRPATGWVVRAPTRSEQPNTFASMRVAVTAGDASVLRPFAPFVGFKRLRARGIIIWTTTIGGVASSPFAPFSRARWPLRLSGFRLDRGWEGQPAPNIQQRLRAVSVRGWNIEVRIYFASQNPNKKLLNEAQAELDRLTPPRTR
jgi:hypothetical protein